MEQKKVGNDWTYFLWENRWLQNLWQEVLVWQLKEKEKVGYRNYSGEIWVQMQGWSSINAWFQFLGMLE